MVEIAGSAISRPVIPRLAAVAAVAVASLTLPLVGVPLALGVAGYYTISLSKPNQVVRGRILSAAQHRRTAIVVGSTVFGLALLSSAALAGLDLAGRLESGLYDRVETAAGAGALQLGATVQLCERLACAHATIVKLATSKTLGLAELHGFAVHDVRAYGWRQPTAQAEGNWPREPGRVR